MGEILKRFLQAGTCVIADAIDDMGEQPRVLSTDLAPVGGKGVRFAGPAYTIAGEAHRWEGGGDHHKLAAIDAMPAGVVAVWAGRDIRGVCCFGDLLSEAMKARGIAGAVVDGGIRDSAFLAELGLPMVARYRTPAQAIGRWRVTVIQEPVPVRGAIEDWIIVHPGDLVVVDDDGVIAVPATWVDDVADRVARRLASESGAREDIRRGMPLLEALAKYGHL